MTNAEKIERRISRFGAEITEIPLLGLKAVTIRTGEKYGVFLDPNEITTSTERAAIEAHECGHIATATTHTLDAPFDEILRQEYRADRWAVHHFLPVRKLKKAMLDGYVETWQIAELLDYPQSFVERAFVIYQAEGRICESK